MSVKIIQGENAEFTIKLRDENCDPYDLTNFSKFKVCMQGASDGTVVEITETPNANDSKVELLGNAVLGKLKVTLDALDTVLLNPAERADIDLEIDSAAGDNPKRTRFEAALTVLESMCG